MHLVTRVLSGVFFSLLVLPALVLAQAPGITQLNTNEPPNELALQPPAFLDAVQSEDDWNALTPEQQAEAAAFFASFGPGLTTANTASPDGTVSCFDYYTFGSVKVNVQGVLASTVSGVPFTFTGTIDNENPYPVVDGAVYMKIFRQPGDGSTPVNGYDVVYQGFVEEGLSLPAGGSMPINFSWNIPAALPSGQYQAAFFYTSAKRFNLLGLPFTDDVVGNTVSFAVTGELTDTVTFQKDSVTVADNNYFFAAFTPKVDTVAPVEVAAVLVNTTDKEQVVPITITTYAWDQQRAENVVDTTTTSVTLAAGESSPLRHVVTDTRNSVYLVVFESSYLDTKSILNVRFTRSDVPTTRINFPAVTSYPLRAGEQATVFSCLHAAGTMEMVAGGKLELTLKDEAGNPFHAYTYEGGVTGAMMGVAEVFTPERDYSKFTLSAALYRDNQLVDTVDMVYDCTALQETCTQVPASVSPGEQGQAAGIVVKLFAMALIFAALLAIAFKIFFKEEKYITGEHTPDDLGNSNGPSPMGPMILLLLAFGSFVFGAGQAEAKSVVWNSAMLPPLAYYWANIHSAWQTSAMTPGAVGCVNPGPGGCGFQLALDNALASVTYKAEVYDYTTGNVLADGAVVPVGTKLQIREIPKINTDISWFGTGHSSDSPYGRWVAAAGPLTSIGCSPGDYTGTASLILAEDPIHTYNMLHVDPKTPLPLPVSANLSCDAGGVCDVTAPGPINLRMSFPETVGRFYHRYVGKIWGNWICGGNNVPLRTFTAEDYSFTYMGVYYAFYANIVPSGSDYFLQIPEQAIDFTFNAISVSENSVPEIPSISNALPQTHMVGDAQTFSVVADDPDGDVLRYGVDWNEDGVVDQWLPGIGHVSGGTSVTTARTWVTAGIKSFQVLAEDINGGRSEFASHQIVICNTGYTWDGATCLPPKPDLVPYASISPLTVFDSVLGVYPQVVIEYSIENNGDVQVDEASENYIGLDRNNDGSYAAADEQYDATDFSLAPLSVGSVSAPKTVVVGTNVPLGTHTILIDVDYDNSIDETDETNNQRTLTLTSPAPSLTLDVSDDFVRAGTTAVLTWATSATYLSSCTIKGPGVNVAINPSVSGSTGTVPTGAIAAKSEYVFSCSDTGGVYSVSAVVGTTGTVQEI
ncbi:MAG: hypothetical protein H6780_03890 [Candidatus Nomurabacteria bacterium]|nr:MAG: hypothetical protein H6780_03890 [Candidatus Nomurabacteria bacterium]